MGEGQLLLDVASRDARMVALRWFFVAVAAGFIYWAWDLAQTFGLSPGDGGVLRPAGQRYALAAFLVVLGLLPLAGILAFSRHYPVRVVRAGDVLLISTASLFARHVARVKVQDVVAVRFSDNRGPIGHQVRAPSLLIEVRGRRFPYVADLQAATVDRAAIERLARRR